MARQKLITKALEKQIPELYATERKKDPIAYAKLFTPWGGWTWYITEYDPKGRLAFGLIQGGPDDEFGYFSLSELEGIVHPRLRLGIERDIYFRPTPVSKLMASSHASSFRQPMR